MTLAEVLGCTLITFSSSLALFCMVVAKAPIRIIVLIAAAFFWLLSLLLSSILWTIVFPLKEFLIFGVTFSIIFQEIFRYLFYLILRKAETGLEKMATVGDDGTGDKNKFAMTRLPMAFVSGLGFGLMSGSFSIINILADASGPGTVGINGGSQYFFLCAAFTSLAFINFNICWTILLFYACDKKNHFLLLFIFCSHLIASYITFLNPLQMYGLSVALEYILFIIVFYCTLMCSGFKYLRISLCK